MTPTTRILFATDFTETSRPAFRKALSMAKAGASLLLAHAYCLPDLSGGPISPGLYEEFDGRLRADAACRLEQLAAEAREEGVDAETLVLFGDPFEAIIEAARDRAADVVIMGTHRRHGLGRFFPGSVASRVISSAPCPVLTVRAA